MGWWDGRIITTAHHFITVIIKLARHFIQMLIFFTAKLLQTVCVFARLRIKAQIKILKYKLCFLPICIFLLVARDLKAFLRMGWAKREHNFISFLFFQIFKLASMKHSARPSHAERPHAASKFTTHPRGVRRKFGGGLPLAGKVSRGSTPHFISMEMWCFYCDGKI